MMLMATVHLVHLICCALAGYTCADWYFQAVEGKGPFIAIGNWRNRSVARRSVHLLNTVAWVAMTGERHPSRGTIEWYGWEGNEP
jgi:hypothetical protein